MKLAFHAATASKCLRARYGSVIVSPDNRVISMGTNGKPRGASNDTVCYRMGLPDNAAKPNCCIHSEVNACLFCSPEERSGATIYVSGIPCTDCLLLLMQSGIRRIVYFNGATASGHRGNSDREFVAKYGFDTRIEFTEFTEEDLRAAGIELV